MFYYRPGQERCRGLHDDAETSQALFRRCVAVIPCLVLLKFAPLLSSADTEFFESQVVEFFCKALQTFKLYSLNPRIVAAWKAQCYFSWIQSAWHLLVL